MSDPCIGALSSNNACTSSFHPAAYKNGWRKPWQSQRVIQQRQEKQKPNAAFSQKSRGSKALLTDFEGGSRRSRISKTLLVHSSFLEHISCSPVVHFASSALGPATSSAFHLPSLLQQYAVTSTSLISSFATQIVHDREAMINHMTAQVTLHGTLQGWLDQIVHGLSLAFQDPANTASSGSSLSLSAAATILTALTGSTIALQSSKEQSLLSLSKLNTLKARLLKLQIKQSTIAKEPGEREKCASGEDAEDSLPLQYDANAISGYYRKRPFLVFSRVSTVLLQFSRLLISIMMDRASGNAKQNERLRASQLVNVLTVLGSTAIKVGQALSVRSDFLSPLYVEELQNLQDNVPPFSSEEARTIIFKSLGRAVNDVYSEFSEQPVAAASLGQVYKARLRESGETVAVKVQRPDVLGEVCLDLYIVRSIAEGLQRLPGHNSSNLLSFINHWAHHFFQELDYIQEAKNAEKFSENMQSLSSVVVPKAITQYTSSKVLTTSWVEGENLSESKEADIPQLVSVALNCYLIQLLETGFLHADPHPGNLLRTPDGRLCVLDFGLMIQVTEEQQYALIDYISHLVNSDYEKVADDLIKLGFLPPHLVNNESATEILPQLSRVLSQLVKGGGIQQMDVNQLTADLAQMATEHSIVIPPYFAMILRAFSILEGIGLKTNPSYVIIDECYPYIWKRLLTDDSPRARTALKYFLYGKKSQQLDARRVEALLLGIQNFRKTMAPTNGTGKSQPVVHKIDSTSQQIIDSLLAPEGSFLQELILAELVRVVDALSREAIFELWNTFVGIALPLSCFIPLPLSEPLSALFGTSRTYILSQEDQEALSLVRRLAGMLGSEINKRKVAGMMTATTAHSVVAFLPEITAGVATASTRFWLMLLHRKALRFADDLDGRNSLVYWNMDPAAFAHHVRPLAFFPYPPP